MYKPLTVGRMRISVLFQRPQKTHRPKTVLARGLLLATAAVLAGCTSDDTIRNQVRSSRDVAYRQWQNRKQRDEQSQPRISGQLSLQDCLKLTLAHNKSLQRVLQEQEVARGERLKSLSARLPSVVLAAEYRRLDEVTSFDIETPAGTEKIQFGDVDNYSAVLSVTQPIYAGGAISAQVKGAKVFTLMTDQTVRAAVQDTVYAAQQAYWNVLLSQHLVKISDDAVRSAQAHLDNVKARRARGVASDFDVLRAEVELSNFQADLIRNRNAIHLARATLIKAMGVSQDSDFVLSDELEYRPASATLEQVVETAFKNRPDLFGSEYNIQYQQELLKTVRSRYLPVVSGYFDNTWSKPDPHNSMLIDWGQAWQAGVRASLPLFDGFAREGDIVQQKARLQQAEIDLVNSEETALLELTQALLSIQDAQEFVETQALNLTRAQEGLRLAQVGYREGTTTQVELIDAQAALTTAGVNHYQAVYSHVMATLALQKAMGTLVHPPTDGTAAAK